MEKLVTDITYLYFGNCRLYLSSIKLPKWRNLTKDNITDIVKNYIIFYNETRIQQKLNDQSPVEYRELVVEGVQQPKGASLQIFLLKCVQNIDRIPKLNYLKWNDWVL